MYEFWNSFENIIGNYLCGLTHFKEEILIPKEGRKSNPI